MKRTKCRFLQNSVKGLGQGALTLPDSDFFNANDNMFNDFGGVFIDASGVGTSRQGFFNGQFYDMNINITMSDFYDFTETGFLWYRNWDSNYALLNMLANKLDATGKPRFPSFAVQTKFSMRLKDYNPENGKAKMMMIQP